jgi:putative transposase
MLFQNLRVRCALEIITRRARLHETRFRKLLKGLRDVPRVIVTAQLGSYRTGKAELISGVEHHQDKGENNRA